MCEPKTSRESKNSVCSAGTTTSISTPKRKLREEKMGKIALPSNDNNKSKCKMALRKIPITSTNKKKFRIVSVCTQRHVGERWVREEKLWKNEPS